MKKLCHLLAVALVLTTPALAQAPAPAPAPAQVTDPVPQSRQDAIRETVQRQLSACWSMPPGYTGHTITIGMRFFGNGTLEGEPEVDLDDSPKSDEKLGPLKQSVIRAVSRCAPFQGLEQLGARPGERFNLTVIFRP